MADAPAHPARSAIFWGGMIAGACDLVFAFSYYGWKWSVFQTVTGGLIGRPAALQGGLATFAAGILLHFLIAFIWAGLFWLLARAVPAILDHAVIAGLVWGLVVFYGMNCVVLPLSALQTKAWPPPFVLPPLVLHLVGVGLPIALAARHFRRRA